MSLMAVCEFVTPPTHPEISECEVFEAFSSAYYSRFIKSDHFGLGRIIARFSITHGIGDLRSAPRIPYGDLEVPVAPDTRIGLPINPILRAHDVRIDQILSKKLWVDGEVIPDDEKKNLFYAHHWEDLKRFHKLNRALSLYSVPPLIAKGDPVWQQMTEEIAHEFAEKKIGDNQLHNWLLAEELTQSRILALPHQI